MHRQKNNPSIVTKKPRGTASGGIVATAISVVAVTTVAVIAATSAVVAEGVAVVTIAASVAMATGVTRDRVKAMVTDAIRGRATFPSQRRACESRSHPGRKRCTSW